MQQEYVIGVMMTPVEDPGPEFKTTVDMAVKIVQRVLDQSVPELKIAIFEFIGPHLSPAGGGYSPLDLLQLGLIEKVERKPNFMLVVTEVELSTRLTTYSIALSSALTNVAILSIKRIDPRFWGDPVERDTIAQRLAGLLLHMMGRLLNLRQHPDPNNIMYQLDELQDLEHMRNFTDQQVAQMKRALPKEARDLLANPPAYGFIVERILANSGSIFRTVVRANPFRLALSLTTMITAAISLIIVIFFSAEIWDIGSTVELYQFIIFSVVAILIATIVLYRSYSLHTVSTRTRRVSESLVVTNAATLLSLFLTMLVLYVLFWCMTYLGIVTFFPKTLMETWPTVDPAVRTLDHIKISTFLAAMGTLVGSLGARAENQEIIRRILFEDSAFL